MKIKTMLLGNLQTNCYIVNNDQNHCFIVDPGANGKKVMKYLTEHELTLEAIVLTHGHFDHIGAIDYLYQEYQCPIYIQSEGVELLHNSTANLSIYEQPFVVEAPVLVAPSKIELAGFTIEWLHMPGHSPDSSMLYLPEEKIIFSGDVLFKQSIGRDDFPNSSRHDMTQSLQKIKEFTFMATVYPGHGEATTLEDELKYNPYLK